MVPPLHHKPNSTLLTAWLIAFSVLNYCYYYYHYLQVLSAHPTHSPFSFLHFLQIFIIFSFIYFLYFFIILQLYFLNILQFFSSSYSAVFVNLFVCFATHSPFFTFFYPQFLLFFQTFSFCSIFHILQF